MGVFRVQEKFRQVDADRREMRSSTVTLGQMLFSEKVAWSTFSDRVLKLIGGLPNWARA